MLTTQRNVREASKVKSFMLIMLKNIKRLQRRLTQTTLRSARRPQKWLTQTALKASKVAYVKSHEKSRRPQ